MVLIFHIQIQDLKFLFTCRGFRLNDSRWFQY